MLEPSKVHRLLGLRKDINDQYRAEELPVITNLIHQAELSQEQLSAITHLATELVTQVRQGRKKTTGIDSFLKEYSLSSSEGVVLMCLAEALLRVPDDVTINSLIKDKLTGADWEAHKGQSSSFFVNAATWALMLTGKVLTPERADSTLGKALLKLVARSGESVVRVASEKAMRIMSKQFVMGRTIKEALNNARKKEAIGYRYSYDMLGEAALTQQDAERYFEAYKSAMHAIGEKASKQGTLYTRPGISIKLSALHPRYQETQKKRVLNEICPKLLELSQIAKFYDIGLTIDAEESERLDLSLDIIEKVFNDDSLDNWQGFGMAVQSYQKRAFWLLDWIAALARSKKRRMTVRLIKGAYWDSEIKKTQMLGLNDYPVFTRKVFTDVSFQACAKKLLTMTDAIYPQFATHNAYSVAMILTIVGEYRDFEFQCLHGMGKELYEEIVPANRLGIPCRIYAPVGSHEDLLPYLVRRLLENGANSSFVNRIVDDNAPISQLIADPVQQATELLPRINQNIPLPRDIFLPQRMNSSGLDFSNRATIADLQENFAQLTLDAWQAVPLINGKSKNYTLESVYSPQAKNHLIGKTANACKEDLEGTLQCAEDAFLTWSQILVAQRAACLLKLATLLEENQKELLALLCLEAGKTLGDALGEIREAVDFCRYYAYMGEQLLGSPAKLQGYTGELNELSLHGRGIVLCISPWNFPLAIFMGQITAALITGNTVIAKPAEQTPLIASLAVQLMYQAGIPKGVVQLLPGTGEAIGGPLTEDKRIKAVLFTGSTETAHRINQTLAARKGEIIPLIAETGGQNAMLVDSSALLEQVVNDVMVSSFGSAGQRCSALRVIYVQEEVYPRFRELLKGAMAELVIGDPQWLSTDVGPVIDAEALHNLKSHIEKMKAQYEIIYQSSLPASCNEGYFMPPTAIEIDSINALEREVFGPVLHVIKFQWKNLDSILEEINNTGYGLTLGIHSRVNSRVNYIKDRIHAGNCYVNRNMIGAVVGLQPFGGEGLSGTGPKAGGPYYLQRLCLERTLTIDTTAAGGNASLMALPEE